MATSSISRVIHLPPEMVPQSLRGAYSGKTFKAKVCEQMTIPSDAGIWDGGSRETYSMVRLADGVQLPAVDHNSAPWDRSRRDIEVKLQPGLAVVCHSMFCGKDMGLTFYVHPENASKLIPQSVELTDVERAVLTATRNYKSSYGGKDRYQMALENGRYDRLVRQNVTGEGSKPFPTRAEWETAKQTLIGKGLLNKAGAITPAGRNSISGDR
jgi:hypothetical protein